jgi:hypothetical protein
LTVCVTASSQFFLADRSAPAQRADVERDERLTVLHACEVSRLREWRQQHVDGFLAVPLAS